MYERYLQALFVALDKDGDHKLNLDEVEHGLNASDIPVLHTEVVALVKRYPPSFFPSFICCAPLFALHFSRSTFLAPLSSLHFFRPPFSALHFPPSIFRLHFPPSIFRPPFSTLHFPPSISRSPFSALHFSLSSSLSPFPSLQMNFLRSCG
jgi:hypothetical protein